MECAHCSKVFSQKRYIKQHLLKSKCGKVSPKLKDLNCLKSAKDFNCLKCTKRFSTQKGLTYHVKTIHSQKTEGLERPLKCKDCGVKFKYLAAFSRHCDLHKVGSELKYKCQHCTALFGNRTSRLLHVQKEHESISTSEVYKNPVSFKCFFCPKSFTRKTNRKNHEKACINRTVENMNPNKCNPQDDNVNNEDRHCTNVENLCKTSNVKEINQSFDLQLSTPVNSVALETLIIECSPDSNDSTMDNMPESPSLCRYLRDRKAFMQLQSPDVDTPRRARINLRYGQETVLKYKQKVRCLQKQISRLREKIGTLENLVHNLQEEKKLSISTEDQLS